MKFNSVEEIRAAFIKKGWSEDTSFTEYDLEANPIGFVTLDKSRKLFVMDGSGNIYDDRGNIYWFNLHPRKTA